MRTPASGSASSYCLPRVTVMPATPSLARAREVRSVHPVSGIAWDGSPGLAPNAASTRTAGKDGLGWDGG